jgi:hypothetical protein
MLRRIHVQLSLEFIDRAGPRSPGDGAFQSEMVGLLQPGIARAGLLRRGPRGRHL